MLGFSIIIFFILDLLFNFLNWKNHQRLFLYEIYLALNFLIPAMLFALGIKVDIWILRQKGIKITHILPLVLIFILGSISYNFVYDYPFFYANSMLFLAITLLLLYFCIKFSSPVLLLLLALEILLISVIITEMGQKFPLSHTLKTPFIPLPGKNNFPFFPLFAFPLIGTVVHRIQLWAHQQKEQKRVLWSLFVIASLLFGISISFQTEILPKWYLLPDVKQNNFMSDGFLLLWGFDFHNMSFFKGLEHLSKSMLVYLFIYCFFDYLKVAIKIEQIFLTIGSAALFFWWFGSLFTRIILHEIYRSIHNVSLGTTLIFVLVGLVTFYLLAKPLKKAKQLLKVDIL